MGFLRFLEGIRIPILNEFMLLITWLGDETAFLVIALILFWCVDKRKGYFVMAVGFVGTILNQFMKLLFRIPRPWVLDENFTILESAREGAGGYSFPSGHTQNAVGTFGAIACTTKERWVRIVSIALAVLIPFSRMYVGVHTPLDVLTAAAMALALLVLLRPLVMENKRFPALLGGMTVLAAAYVCYVELFQFPADVDQENLASGVKNAYTLLGAVLGMTVVYIVDEKWLQFPVKAIWWAQMGKVVLGLLLVLAVKSGLKAPLNTLCGASVGTLLRYFLVVLTAGILWPLTFRCFARLGTKE